MMSSSGGGRGMRFPFTPSQWQELEHQALIYKYMVSGIPIPPDLLFSIKRSCLDSPPLSSKLFSPHIGWNCFQMGLGRKIDPEPGRCRRTDGKKWRCSKEAYADSKYCERHMHRGKNRSRKPVEVFKPTSANSNSNLNTSPITKIFNPPSTSLSSPFHSLSSLSPNESSYKSNSSNLDDHPFLYSRPNLGLSQQERSTSLFLDSASYNSPLHPNLEYRPNRFGYGMKEEVDEHAFFSEPSGSVRGFSGSSSSLDHHQNESNWLLTMSCSNSSSKQRTCSALQTEHYPHLQLQNFSDSKMERRGEETQRTIHHFFDEGPPKDRESSWLDLDANNKSSNSGCSTTRLSISIPNSAYDFPIFSSRNHHED